MKTLTLVGPESTGKTTLAAELARDFGTVWVPEASRAYAMDKAGPLTVDDVLPIARRHCREADAGRARARHLLVLDTDLVMTCVYSELYYGVLSAELLELTKQRLADRYLLLEPDVPWVADPVRDMPARREEIRDRVLEMLRRVGASHAAIAGDWKARREKAAREAKALLNQG